VESSTSSVRTSGYELLVLGDSVYGDGTYRMRIPSSLFLLESQGDDGYYCLCHVNGVHDDENLLQRLLMELRVVLLQLPQ
jgi:hypothetical protein